MTRTLQENLPGSDAQEIVELGAGDGHFLLSVAKSLNGNLSRAQATLVDRLDTVDPQVCDEFNRLGWRVQTKVAEANEWLREATPENQKPSSAICSFTSFKQSSSLKCSGLQPLHRSWSLRSNLGAHGYHGLLSGCSGSLAATPSHYTMRTSAPVLALLAANLRRSGRTRKIGS